MFEIRLDEDLITCSSELRDALIETIDYILGREEPTLRELYQRYFNHTSEDLIEEINSMTDKRLTIIVNLPVDAKVSVLQHILEQRMTEEHYDDNARWAREYIKLSQELGQEINSLIDQLVSLKQENKRLKRENWNLKQTKGMK